MNPNFPPLQPHRPPSTTTTYQPYGGGYPNPNPNLQLLQEYGDDKKQPKINTLFLSGLPDDVKPREIHNLFRRRNGFDFCQMKYTGRGNQVVAFATFFNHHSAISTMNALNGVVFDPEKEATLHVELARSNSRQKRLRGGEAYFVIDKRPKVKISTDVQETSSDEGDDRSSELFGTNTLNPSGMGDLATTERSSGKTSVDPDNAEAAVDKLPEKSDNEGVPPCSTLFIANLGPNCTDEELKQAFSQSPGLNIVKIRANRGMPVAFADFESVESATDAKQSLQGSMLPSSDRGGMHLEYAKSKMRK